eukprot:1205639-Amphidinium_carterae.1
MVLGLLEWGWSQEHKQISGSIWQDFFMCCMLKGRAQECFFHIDMCEKHIAAACLLHQHQAMEASAGVVQLQRFGTRWPSDILDGFLAGVCRWSHLARLHRPRRESMIAWAWQLCHFPFRAWEGAAWNASA